MKGFLVLVAFALLETTSAQVAKPCRGAAEPNYISANVFIGDTECTKSPCNLVRGKDAKALVVFETDNLVNSITMKAEATTLGVTTNYPIPNATKGCDQLQDGYCPLDKGEIATIALVVKVLEVFPKVDLTLLLSTVDENGKELFCFSMEGKVVD